MSGDVLSKVSSKTLSSAGAPAATGVAAGTTADRNMVDDNLVQEYEEEDMADDVSTCSESSMGSDIMENVRGPPLNNNNNVVKNRREVSQLGQPLMMPSRLRPRPRR